MFCDALPWFDGVFDCVSMCAHINTHAQIHTFVLPITCAYTLQVHMGLNAEEVMIEMVEDNA